LKGKKTDLKCFLCLFILEPWIMTEHINAFWYNNVPNFGDALNRNLIRLISGKEVRWIDPRHTDEVVYVCIGSIMRSVSENSIVWGTGMIDKKRGPKVKPKAVKAVRGPETRKALLKHQITCPEIYGDPALLLPRFYMPKIKKKYKLGIVPHYFDKAHTWLKKIEDRYVKVLDVQKLDVFSFVDDLLTCERIASSSLHGIIAADAYGIPSTWLTFSKGLFNRSSGIKGKGFKFRDYFLSVKRRVESPLKIRKITPIKKIYDRFHSYQIDIDLDKLYLACPFRKD